VFLIKDIFDVKP